MSAEKDEQRLREEILSLREKDQLSTAELIKTLHIGHSTLVRLLNRRYVTPKTSERLWRTLEARREPEAEKGTAHGAHVPPRGRRGRGEPPHRFTRSAGSTP